MRKNVLKAFVLAHVILFTTLATAGTLEQELEKVAAKVAELNLGFGDYILGASLAGDQKQVATDNSIAKATKDTYKFKDGDIFVVAALQDDTIIGLYRQYNQANKDQIKSLIGELMLNHGEPTAMAHDKLVYWTYNKSGKISQDEFDFARQNGGSDSLVTVKLSSSEPLFTDAEKDVSGENYSSDVYIMITSDPMSKLFLAQNTSSTTAQK